jgi:hypothetical protein
MKDNENLWFGVPRIEVSPPRPYRVTHSEAINRGEDRGLASYLGQIVERSVVSIWNHPELRKCIDPQALESNVSKITGKLAEAIGTKRLKSDELSRGYEALYDQGAAEVLFKSVEKVLGMFDNGNSFNALRESLNSVNHKRYAIETTLMIAKEVLEPSFIPNKGSVIVPGLAVGDRDVVFDGVVVPVNCFYPEISFKDIQVGNIPWTILEIKAVFQTWRVTGDNSLGRPPQAFTSRLKRQMIYAEDWMQRKLESVNFHYPDSIALFCLRGVKPSRSFSENCVEKHLHLS